MPTTYTISQAANLLRKSPTATRRFADAMAEVLPDYTPTTGKARKFTQDDLRTLLALSARLSANPALTQQGLLSELSAHPGAPLIIPDTLPTDSPTDSPGKPVPTIAIAEDLHPTHTALQQAQAAIAPLSERFAEMERKIDGLQSQLAPASPPDGAERMIAAVLISLGVIFATVIVAALVWPSAGLVGLVIVAAVLTWGIAPLRTRG